MQTILLNVYSFLSDDSGYEKELLKNTPVKKMLLSRLIKTIYNVSCFNTVVICPERDLPFILELLESYGERCQYFPVSDEEEYAFRKYNLVCDSLKMFSYPLYGAWHKKCLDIFEVQGIRKAIIMDAFRVCFFREKFFQELYGLLDEGNFSLMLDDWESWILGADLKELKAEVSLYDNKKKKRFKELNAISQSIYVPQCLNYSREDLFIKEINRTFLVEKLRTADNPVFLQKLKNFKDMMKKDLLRINPLTTFGKSVFKQYIENFHSDLSRQNDILVPEVVNVFLDEDYSDFSMLDEWFQAKIFYFICQSNISLSVKEMMVRHVKKLSPEVLVYWQENLNLILSLTENEFPEEADVFVINIEQENLLLMGRHEESTSIDNILQKIAENAFAKDKQLLLKIPLIAGQENHLAYICNKWNYIVNDVIIENVSEEFKTLYPELEKFCSISPRTVTLKNNGVFDLCPQYRDNNGSISEWCKMASGAGSYPKCRGCSIKQKFGHSRKRFFSLKPNLDKIVYERLLLIESAISEKRYHLSLDAIETILKVRPLNSKAWEFIEKIECQL